MLRNATVALVTAVIATAAGCGGGGEHHDVANPQALLRSTAAHPIQSARIEAALTLRVEGYPELSSPVSLRLQGPFVSGGRVRIPSFDWKLGAKVLGFGVSGRVASTGQNVFVSLYGDNYEVGRSTVAAANQRIQADSAGAATRTDLFGLHPLSWFGRPRYLGEQDAGGVDCAHLSARIRGSRLAQDLEPLAARLGLSTPPAASGTVQGWVGFDDHVLHRLVLDAQLTVPVAERSLLDGASGARLTADVSAADVGVGQQISIPGGGGYKPIRDLFLSLNDLGVPGLSLLGLI